MRLETKNDFIHQNDPLKKAKIVQRAFDNIMKKENMDEIDHKLIESLDENIMKLLEGVREEEKKTQNMFFSPSKREKVGNDNDVISLDREKESIFEEKNEINGVYK